MGQYEEMRQVDAGIRPLVIALRRDGLDTDWSCEGDKGHMCIRPTVQIRTAPFPDAKFLDAQRRKIEVVMDRLGLNDYWLSLVFAHGGNDTHGGEPTWLLQISGRYDFLSLPVGYSKKYLGKDSELEGYIPLKDKLVK